MNASMKEKTRYYVEILIMFLTIRIPLTFQGIDF